MSNMKKIAFVVSQLGPDQLCYDIIKSSNEYMRENDDVDISLYWIQDGPRIIEPNFACMCIFELFAFPGHTIATNLHTLSRVLTYPGPNRNKWIYFYDYNLDYTKIPQQYKSWEQLNSLYNHPKVQLIARSQEHADILSSVFRPPIAIIDDANIGKLLETIIL